MSSLPWDVVESAIEKEIEWLRGSFRVFYHEKFADNAIPTCHDCLFRRIAILIVAGRITAQEIIKSPELNSLWLSTLTGNSDCIKIYHGKLWHSQMIEKIANHFKNQGYDLMIEPPLRWGRADLGVTKQGERSFYIEVGTISIFKLWMNLKTLTDHDYLIVPDENKIIQFGCVDKS